MPDKLQKKDFVEIEFTGRTKEGEIFDSNIKEDLQKANLKVPAKPFIFSLGSGMFLQGIDDFLIGKEIGEYSLELSPEQAFGKRDSKAIQLISMKIFKEQKLNPIPGAMFNFDGRVAKILSVSGGRVIVDFNNPLAGKDVSYRLNVLRKIENISEKVKSLTDFFFRKEFKFEVKEKNLIIEAEKGFSNFLELFKDKFKEILDLELIVKETAKPEVRKEKVEEKPQQSL